MLRTIPALLLAGLVIAVSGGVGQAETKTGEAKFTAPKKELIKVEMGGKLKLNVELKMFELGARAAVSVSGKVKNTTDAQMHYSYNVAFLDKDKNLVGCQNFALSVQPGKEGSVGTFIFLPRDEIAKIAYYSIAFHESDMPIGSK